MVRSWEAPCRPGAEGWRSRTWSCALAVSDALVVRHSNPNRYRPSWDKQVSSDKASPPTHCANLVSRNRGSPDRFESDWMHDTARCLGYPSDSTRAARERAPGDNLHRFLSPLWLRLPAISSRPCGLSLRPCGSTSCYLLSPLWLSSPPLWLNSLSSGRRRQSATSHGPWAVCLGRSLPRQIKPGPSVAAAALGVQREAGLGWQGLRVATGAPCTLSHLAGVGS